MIITEIIEIDIPDYVYDIEVEDNHNFFANNILVHNCDTYLGSDERREWIGNLSPEYMYGLTGTPHVNHMDDAVFDLYYGPKTDLILFNETPNYLRVKTGFKYGEFDINEMHEMKQELYLSPDRNQLIIDTYATYSKGRKGLIFTEHVEHAKVLKESLERKGIKTFIMIGEVKDSEREQIRSEVKTYKGDCCIVGSVKIIGRGFDIPELSLAILTTAERFNANINQYMGRIIRKFEGKPKPLFIDMYDLHTPFLRRQSSSRFATYQKTFPDGASLTK